MFSQLSRCHEQRALAAQGDRSVFPWQFRLSPSLLKDSSFCHLWESLVTLLPNLRWHCTFSEVHSHTHYVRAHLHTIIIGRQGIEERDDIAVGATVIAPSPTFPHLVRYRGQVILMLASGEVRKNGGSWRRVPAGTVLHTDERFIYELRNRDTSLLILWCETTL
ncbi:dimethylsulfonioproprionate lyase family protein [Brucella sp. NBRC 12950]|uniref:dimethylsulfonioproprionate lyase family protein n=1 Tax=Brucella sp. NBRC 12950 TaxID=2994518 RepID=UPI003331F3E6